MPGKGHYKLFTYEASLWHTLAIAKPDTFVIYDVPYGSSWWQGRNWTYRRTVTVPLDAAWEPMVPPGWKERALAYTEWEYFRQVPDGCDIWVTADNTYWDVWWSPLDLWQWQWTPYAAWRLLETNVYDPCGARLSKL